jgi:N-acetylmuramoyl-L-alanine amidase
LRKSFWSSKRAKAAGKITLTPQDLPRVVELTSRRPFLNVGRGTDRLGGAKLGYLQPGVRMMVAGKMGRQYRVKLTESMEAWLPEEFATLLPKETPLPSSLVGSISALGTDREDVISIGLSQRLPYTSEQQLDPAAITVDIYGATSNTNWITHHLSASGIQSVSWDQVAAAHYRLTILLTTQNHWGYDIGYDNGSNLRIRVRRPPIIASVDSVLKGMLIVVDAGHGGENKGALGSTGAKEMDVNLAIVRHLEQVLAEKGATSVLTRSDTSGWSMNDRTDRILKSDARLLVSVHCNSIGLASDPEKIRGTATFYRYVGFKPLADAVYRKMLDLGFEQFGVVGSFNFSLNAPTQLPNVLVETAFLSNPEDEMILIDDSSRRRIAEKIVEGLEHFVRAAASHPPPTSSKK